MYNYMTFNGFDILFILLRDNILFYKMSDTWLITFYWSKMKEAIKSV